MQESDLLAKNDDAVQLKPPRSLWEPSLLAKNDDVVCLTHRSA